MDDQASDKNGQLRMHLPIPDRGNNNQKSSDGLCQKERPRSVSAQAAMTWQVEANMI
jgi:hypothetical protein